MATPMEADPAWGQSIETYVVYSALEEDHKWQADDVAETPSARLQRPIFINNATNVAYILVLGLVIS